MIYRHTEEEIQYYFSAPALNQSSIKVILKDGIQKFAELEEQLISQEDLYYEEKQHFIIGSAVDHIITQGMESFNNKYAYSTLTKKPPETVMSIIKSVFDKKTAEDGHNIQQKLNNYELDIMNSCNDHSYYMNRAKPTILLDKRAENILKDGTAQTYWEELLSSRGKQLLSVAEKDKIEAVSNSLLSHKHTKHLFEDIKGTDTIFQIALFFEYNEVMCKSLIDCIKIDHTKKKILVIDIKTLGDYVLRFSLCMRTRRYDLQGSFYYKAVKENLEEISKLIGVDVTKYSISNPAFAVESTLKPGTPMIYVMTDDLMEMGIAGDNRFIQGYFQGVELYKQWKEIGYSLDERFKNSNGIVWIDNNFMYNEEF